MLLEIGSVKSKHTHKNSNASHIMIPRNILEHLSVRNLMILYKSFVIL